MAAPAKKVLPAFLMKKGAAKGKAPAKKGSPMKVAATGKSKVCPTCGKAM